MLKNARYRFWSWVFEKYEPRFRPIIPDGIKALGKPFKLDMEIVRWSGKKLSVEQVDELLDAQPTLKYQPQQRMYAKNLLVAIGIMDLGILDREHSLTGPEWHADHLSYNVTRPMRRKLWRRGYSLKYTRFQRWQARGGWLQYKYQGMAVLWERAKRRVKEHTRGFRTKAKAA